MFHDAIIVMILVSSFFSEPVRVDAPFSQIQISALDETNIPEWNTPLQYILSLFLIVSFHFVLFFIHVRR